MDTNDALPIRIEELLSHRAWVGGLARALVGDDSTAEDLVQDTFTTALERPPDRRTSLRGWLATVLRNRLRDRYRVESRRVRREEIAARRESVPATAELAATADAHRRVLEAVLGLDEPYREAVLLRYYEGVSAAEVAKRQGVPPSTARTRLKRARDRLRERLDREHGGDGRAWALALVPFLELAPEPAGPRPVGAVGGLGAFLMAHKAKLVAATLTAFVLISVMVSAGGPAGPVTPAPPVDVGHVAEVPAPGPGPGEGAAADDAGAAAKAAPFRLPTTSRADGEPLPIADTEVIEIARDGGTTMGDIEESLAGDRPERTWKRLLLFAEEKRDLDHPMQPSKCGVLLRVDAGTPWKTVRTAMALPADPDVRMYRIYWAAMRGKTEVGLPVFTAKDRGLAMTKVKLLRPLRARVTLRRSAGKTEVRLLDRELGSDEAGLESLDVELPALLANASRVPPLIDLGEEVPFEQVIRVLDLVPKPYAEHLSDFSPTWSVYRLASGPTGRIEGTVEDLERKFVPKPEDLVRVRELLAKQGFSATTLYQLLDRILPSRSLALALGRAYLAGGEKTDLLRAVTLGALVSGENSTKRYDRTWWEAEVLLLRAILGYAKLAKDDHAVEMGLARCRDATDLGLVGRSPLRGEIQRLHGDFESLAETKK